MFKITQGSGFMLTFGNGWTVSVQFGAGNYGSNRNAGFFDAKKADPWESRTAEIAAWYGERGRGMDNWYNFGNGNYDQVKGWCTTDEVVEFLGMVSKLPSCKQTDADYPESEAMASPV